MLSDHAASQARCLYLYINCQTHSDSQHGAQRINLQYEQADDLRRTQTTASLTAEQTLASAATAWLHDIAVSVHVCVLRLCVAACCRNKILSAAMARRYDLFVYRKSDYFLFVQMVSVLYCSFGEGEAMTHMSIQFHRRFVYRHGWEAVVSNYSCWSATAVPLAPTCSPCATSIIRLNTPPSLSISLAGAIALRHRALLHHYHSVAVGDSHQAVSDSDDCSLLEARPDDLLQQCVRPPVDICRGLVHQ